jgi:hypothetical protein
MLGEQVIVLSNIFIVEIGYSQIQQNIQQKSKIK